MSPTGKSFRFVRACVRAVIVTWKGASNVVLRVFPLPFWPREAFRSMTRAPCW